MPAVIEGYVQWTLTAVEAVSAHSALFRFETSNLKRGTVSRERRKFLSCSRR